MQALSTMMSLKPIVLYFCRHLAGAVQKQARRVSFMILALCTAENFFRPLLHSVFECELGDPRSRLLGYDL